MDRDDHKDHEAEQDKFLLERSPEKSASSSKIRIRIVIGAGVTVFVYCLLYNITISPSGSTDMYTYACAALLFGMVVFLLHFFLVGRKDIARRKREVAEKQLTEPSGITDTKKVNVRRSIILSTIAIALSIPTLWILIRALTCGFGGCGIVGMFAIYTVPFNLVASVLSIVNLAYLKRTKAPRSRTLAIVALILAAGWPVIFFVINLGDLLIR